MEKGFKFRHVNELSGVFVILTLALFVIFIFLTGRAQMWFGRSYGIQIQLPEEGSYGLRKGAEVEFLGAIAGEVKNITISREGRMTAELSIQPNFFRILRVDSVAIIRSSFGISSKVYVELTRGTGTHLPEKGAVIASRVDKGIVELMKEKLYRLEGATLPTIQEYGKLAAELRDPNGPLYQMLDRMNRLARNLEEGESAIAKLLTDESLGTVPGKILVNVNAVLGEIQTFLEDAQETSRRISALTERLDQQVGTMPRIASQTGQVLEKVGVVLQDMHSTMNKFPEILGTLQGELETLPGLVLQTKKTLEEVERLVVAMQKHWLLREYVEKPDSGIRISPTEFGKEMD